MVRRAYRLVALAVVLALGLSLPGVAAAEPKDPPKSSGCKVIVIVEGGAYEATVAEGTKIGPYVCFGGRWLRTVLAHTGYTDTVTVQPDGAVTIDNFTFDGPGDLTMAEFTDVMYELAGVESEPVDRAVVATDNGTELTDEQVDALLEGKDAGDVKVLAVVDSPDPSVTFKDLGDKFGGGEPVQVIARKKGIFGRIWRWIKKHCQPIPPKCTIRW